MTQDKKQSTFAIPNSPEFKSYYAQKTRKKRKARNSKL